MDIEEIKKIVPQIIKHRKEKKYKEADELRQKILEAKFHFEIQKDCIMIYQYYPLNVRLVFYY